MVPAAMILMLAGAIAILGLPLTVQYYLRARQDPSHRRIWWVVMSGVASGIVLWATNLLFILGLARAAGAATAGFEPAISAASLFGGTCILIFLTRAGAKAQTGVGRRMIGGLLGGMIACMAMATQSALLVAGDVVLDWRLGAGAVAWSTIGTFVISGRTEPNSSLRLRLLVLAGAFINIGAFFFLIGGAIRFQLDESVAVPAHALSGDAVVMVVTSLIGITALGGHAFVSIDRIARRDVADAYRHLALHDPLTGLPNRAYLREELERLLRAPARDAGKPGFALVGVDLDRFKPVNDVHGHGAGDALLEAIAENVRRILEPGELFARTGGDEFVALSPSGDREEASAFAERLRAAISQPLFWEDAQLSVGASLGVVLHRDADADIGALLNWMDLALYRAKAAGGDTIRFYEARMDESRRARFALAMELRRALDQGEFELNYQAQTELISGRPVAYEALIRWNHPERGRIPPDEFIPVAEETGLIRQIGAWVLHTACRDAAAWPEDMRVAVNVSPIQIGQPDFVEVVEDALLNAALQARRLELEMTEAALLSDQELLRSTMGRLKTLGVRLALDDYGTGYASLATLRGFPFDRVKIDRSFILDLERDPQAADIVRSTLLLGRALQLPVVAEGIESEGHRAFLISEGCLEGQGYLFSRPVPATELRKQMPTTPTPAAVPFVRQEETAHTSARSASSSAP